MGRPIPRNPLWVLAVVAVVFLVALPSLPAEVHWPWFGTLEMRLAAEEVFPPTPELTFTDAWIRRNLEPLAHEQCVAYRTSADPDLVAAHYRNRFHELDWTLLYDNRPDQRRGTDDYFIEGVFDGVSVLLHADPAVGSLLPSALTAETPYAVQVCTLASWVDIAKTLKAANS